MTANADLGMWLRGQREDRRWTRTEMARRIIKAATAAGDTAVPSAAHLTHNLYRWERGTVGPSERYRLYCCDALGIPFRRFGPASTGTSPVPRLAGARTMVITIALPEGADAEVSVTRHRGSPPPVRTGQATAG